MSNETPDHQMHTMEQERDCREPLEAQFRRFKLALEENRKALAKVIDTLGGINTKKPIFGDQQS